MSQIVIVLVTEITTLEVFLANVYSLITDYMSDVLKTQSDLLFCRNIMMVSVLQVQSLAQKVPLYSLEHVESEI